MCRVQVGDGTTVNRQNPVQVIGLSTGVTGVAAGGVRHIDVLYAHRSICLRIFTSLQAGTCAIVGAGGALYCWGDWVNVALVALVPPVMLIYLNLAPQIPADKSYIPIAIEPLNCGVTSVSLGNVGHARSVTLSPLILPTGSRLCTLIRRRRSLLGLEL